MEWLKKLVKQLTTRGRHAQLICAGPTRIAGQRSSLIDGLVYPAPNAQYHGIRPDGVYVPIVYIDGRGDHGQADGLLAACKAETDRLRSAGHVVAV